jgi:uncharacterized membrane protein
MSKIADFLSPNDERSIVDAIITAEKNTSGEIRVHIESNTDLDHFERTKEVFHLLKMDNTKAGNGVLLYIAVNDKKFVIYGDVGIDRVVPNDFWDSTRNLIENKFKQGHFKQGIIDGILKIGQELKKHFPWKPNDTNELNDEISKG